MLLDFELSDGTSINERDVAGLRVNSHGDEGGSNHSVEAYSKKNNDWQKLDTGTINSLHEANGILKRHNQLSTDRYFEKEDGHIGIPDAIYLEARAKRDAEELKPKTNNSIFSDY